MLAALKYFFRAVIRHGNLTLVDADGVAHRFGDGSGQPVTIKLHNRAVYRRLVLNPALQFGEAYMDGSLTIEEGSLYDALVVFLSNLQQQRPKLMAGLDHVRVLLRRFHQYNPASRSRGNVAHHYDLDGEFYDLFLDSDRQYSCGYFETDDMSLEEAQLAKKRHIAAKLNLKAGQRVLDIGSGWGGLGLYLAETAGVDVTGITLSKEQLKVSTARVADANRSGSVRFLLEDYRDLEGPFDRIVSVGMFEHVGVSYFRTYFRKVHDLLSDDGVALIHTIGRSDGPGATNSWAAKYIFPGAYSPALSEMMPAIEQAGLLVTDVEVLRLHYAKTLQEWLNRFYAQRDAIASLYDERFCRMWEFYLASAEVCFRYQDLNIFQIQLTKNLEALPLTRDYMFNWERKQRRRDAARNTKLRAAE